MHINNHHNRYWLETNYLPPTQPPGTDKRLREHQTSIGKKTVLMGDIKANFDSKKAQYGCAFEHESIVLLSSLDFYCLIVLKFTPNYTTQTDNYNSAFLWILE